MGCDIHLIAQRKIAREPGSVLADRASGYEDIADDFLKCRSYGLFGFLANVRNYSAIGPIAEQRGLPDDFHDEKHDFRQDEGYYYHSHTWLSVRELLDYDYGQIVEDRRVTINGNGGCTAPPGGGESMPLREFLGEWYFTELGRLQAAGADRIVFCFDN